LNGRQEGEAKTRKLTSKDNENLGERQAQ